MLIHRAATALLLAVVFCASIQSADEALVANPDYAAWAKVEKGTQVKISRQRVNVMDIAKHTVYTVDSINENEVVLVDSDKNNLKIPAKVAAFKDTPGDKPSEHKLKGGGSITSKPVTRTTAGQDVKVWLSAEVPGGVVVREWDDPKEKTIVEKVVAFKAPGKEWKEFEQPKPDPNSAHPIETPPPQPMDADKAK